jgi:hypothetical protein
LARNHLFYDALDNLHDFDDFHWSMPGERPPTPAANIARLLFHFTCSALNA